MNLTTLTQREIGSPSDLITLSDMFEEMAVSGSSLLFRGQPSDYGNLQPTLARKVDGAPHGAVSILESQLLKSFRTHYANLPALPGDMPPAGHVHAASDVEVMSLMQHYEVPSRLLDWTQSIWVAAYFACASNSGKPGELWVMDETLLEVDPTGMPVEKIRDAVSKSVSSRPGDYHPSWGMPFLVVIEPIVNSRLQAQRGKLTASDYATYDHAQILWKLATKRTGGDHPGSSFGRYIFRPERKGDILRFLDTQKGVSARTLFPDIVGLGRFLGAEFEALRSQLL
ncbi:hypothetical protein RD110_18835 [Rhodoferax koreense]|uniref:FRG domain-containing protein n=1 Tax=Rhodoferax koreensis TaxID=1842727 RepID=A0A1P8JZ85_9BURK|nr:FRG domain-containing protein [Rhodoferax koreense]APW39011.1 hypothetical protein RD110_18835 [Rhodoferax koreense]